ncbi:hypothetical protein B0T19DRAFT_416207 [Cercophora scortea]|uniref:Uncharacterized protein n=1 Tax=Cercophora scortea TaxID=314031 RepID=A0AAE0MIU4_9PEZI|nr:hypothetical protein B0T19DRAFT_416207 [Cercophora scortea]
MIFPTMVVEDNRTKLATGATNVDSKVYPDTFRRWTEFPTLHAGRFDLLVRALGDSEIFPSLFEVRSTSRNLSPTTRKDEQDIRPFIRAHEIDTFALAATILSTCSRSAYGPSNTVNTSELTTRPASLQSYYKTQPWAQIAGRHRSSPQV